MKKETISKLTEIINYFECEVQDATCQTDRRCVWCKQNPFYKKRSQLELVVYGKGALTSEYVMLTYT